MEKNRLPRFRRVGTVGSIQLNKRDQQIIRLIHRHRFLPSHHITALIGGSAQQILRRLQLLYHHGYLERPRAQLAYYQRGGSHSIVYGLGNKGGALLRHEFGIAVDSVSWSEKNHAIGRMFLEHALFVASIMVTLELACRKNGSIRLLYEDDLGLPVKQSPARWRVSLSNGVKLGVIPDRIFALEYQTENRQTQRAFFFLEADRGTMPVVRPKLLQTSFLRKLLAYEATWTQKVHQRYLGLRRFRVLTVTTVSGRVESLIDACAHLKHGHGLFLFAEKSVLEHPDILFAPIWQTGRPNQSACLLENPTPKRMV